MPGIQSKKKSSIGMCAYCAGVRLKVEDEHVFPESWYPDGFPRSAMVIVPACRRCNGSYGRIEERMFLPLVGGLSWEDPTARTIIGRAMRGVDPDSGRDLHDVSHRGARRRSILRRLTIIAPGDLQQTTVWSPTHRTSHELRSPAGLYVKGMPAIQFNPDDLDTLAIKFLKGCYFALRRVPLRADAVCIARIFAEDPHEALEHAKRNLSLNFGGQPPFQYAFARATEDDATTIWWFVLWNHYVMTASSVSPEHLPLSSPSEDNMTGY